MASAVDFPIRGATVPVGTYPIVVGENPTTNRIYVANYDNNTASVIDGTSITFAATVPVGSYLGGTGVNPTTNRVYVSNTVGNTVSVIGYSPGRPDACWHL